MAKVITWPNAKLEKVATPVPHGERCRELIDVMFAALDYPNGIGLAAPQIGEDKRIIVIMVPALKNGQIVSGCTKMALINPEIEWMKGGPYLDYEGCLSFPDMQVMVPRYQRIRIKAFDLRWNPITVGGKDLVARVMQHEIDHLNGRTLAYYYALAHQVLDEKERITSAALDELALIDAPYIG
jgi:peptide deformylase